MFYYLTGTIAVLDQNLAVVDCGGVGYACHTTAYTIAQLKIGQETRLYTYCNIREDAFDIFGFSTREEKRCFELLLSVSGVGPKAALAILSVVTPEGFTLAVMTGDEKTLQQAQGVGKKMAQRMILELKDKLGGSLDTMGVPASAVNPAAAGVTNKVSLASAALAELGYSSSEIAAAMKGIAAEELPVEETVRQCLRAMVMGR